MRNFFIAFSLVTTVASAANLSQQEFNAAIDKVEIIYQKEFAKSGRKFVVERLWDDTFANAKADYDSQGNPKIIMRGGLAYHSTPDAISLIACHEIGHHIGG
ncbi:MAG: hypothetical protein ACJ76H_13705, partial [Bacteriovoracaceae bacterium]